MLFSIVSSHRDHILHYSTDNPSRIDDNAIRISRVPCPQSSSIHRRSARWSLHRSFTCICSLPRRNPSPRWSLASRDHWNRILYPTERLDLKPNSILYRVSWISSHRVFHPGTRRFRKQSTRSWYARLYHRTSHHHSHNVPRLQHRRRFQPSPRFGTSTSHNGSWISNFDFHGASELVDLGTLVCYHHRDSGRCAGIRYVYFQGRREPCQLLFESVEDRESEGNS